MTSAHRSEGARSGAGSGWLNALLTVGALLGALCIIIALAGAILDFRTLVFRSGSMSPEISTGALAFAKDTPANELAVGDVVSVLASNGTRITHRVQELTMSGQSAQLTLKGDANSRPDAETYTVSSADRVVLDVPYIGYVIGYATSPIGIFVGGALAAGLLWLIFRPAGRSGGPRGRSRRGARRGTRRAGAAGAILAGAGLLMAPTTRALPTMAAFTDSGTALSGILAAHTVTPQAQPACNNVDGLLVLGNIARLTWSQADGRYEYYWELRRADNATAVSSGVVGTGIAQNQTVTLDLGTGLIGVNTNYNVVIRARLVSPNTWVASTTTTTPVRRASILVIGAAFRCGHT